LQWIVFSFFSTKIVHPFQKGKKIEDEKKTNVHPLEGEGFWKGKNKIKCSPI
jgi:hypothetical protein